MKSGKLDWDELKQLIEKNKSVNREEVRIRSGIGEDCSVIKFGNYECVLSTDPITASDRNIGKLAVHVNCNDIASSGAETLGILVTILAPENTTINEINEIMKEIDNETKKLNVEILGGHTEVTSAVNKIVVSCTAIGKIESGRAISTAGAKIDDDVVVTKKLCIEGTSILVNDYYEKALEVLDEIEMLEARSYIENLSVVKEGMLAGEFQVNSMHDITEGGVLGALWEVAEASNTGFRVYENEMPITDITRKLCKHFGINPLKLISSGSMIITTKNGEMFTNYLKENGINATIIGKITEKKGILVCSDGKEIEVQPPKRDELLNV